MTVRTHRLSVADAGELLTLQRAAFAAEAVLHDDPQLPPLVETLAALRAGLSGTDVVLGVRDGARLIASGRFALSDDGRVAVIARLVVAPDRQGEGLGRVLLTAVEDAAPPSVREYRLLTAVEDAAPPSVREYRLFTGEHSTSNLRRYERAGYVVTGRTSTPAGYDLVHLAKPRA